MEWMHLEPIHQRVPTPFPANISTNIINKNIRSTKDSNTETNTKKDNTKDNRIIINKLYTTIQSLKSENIGLRKYIRKLKYCLHHIPQTHKTLKNTNRKRKYLKN